MIPVYRDYMAKSKLSIRERITAFAQEMVSEVVAEVVGEMSATLNEGTARGGPRRKSRKKRAKKKVAKKTTKKTRRLNASSLKGQSALVYAFIKKNKKGVNTDQLAKGLKLSTQTIHTKTSMLAQGKLIQKKPAGDGTNKKLYFCP